MQSQRGNRYLLVHGPHPQDQFGLVEEIRMPGPSPHAQGERNYVVVVESKCANCAKNANSRGEGSWPSCFGYIGSGVQSPLAVTKTLS